jgi:hypothetical protein
MQRLARHRKPGDEMSEQEKMQADMRRLRGYFPFRIVWGALKGDRYETGANVTMRQANDMARKGWQVFTFEGDQ